VVDRTRLRDRLPAPDGLAVDDEEYAVGVHCLAAPLPAGTGPGSLGFVTPTAERGSERVRRTLGTAAARVARALVLS